jgi:anti-sigma factor RsiW
MLGSREGELGAEERAALAAHLEGCGACRARLADLAAMEGLVAEGLSRAAARRDFSTFADEVMAQVGRESRSGIRAFLRRHRMAVRFATALAPALAAVALIVYLGRSPGGAPDVDVTSELDVPIVISTTDGPMVLLGDGDEPEGS